MGNEMVAWSRRCSSALGLIACVLDERGTFQRVGENVIVTDPNGDVVAVADMTLGVRHFGPGRQVSEDTVRGLANVKFDDRVRTACRWFLRGVAGGPSEPGLLFLATAIESLVNDPRTGKSGSSFNPNRIRAAYADAGGVESQLALDIGRCAGLRARVVHHGVEDHDELRSGWYGLEEVARTLLRDIFDMIEAWPISERATLRS